MPPRPSCDGCVFFARTSSARGKCRRYPPLVYYDANAKQATELWPSVNDNWWCGEFRPRRSSAAAKATGDFSREGRR